MSGIPRDLAAPELWQASMQRSLARREGRCIPASDDRGDPLGDQTTSAPRNRLMPRERPATVRDLADGETWDLSLGRSRARRRAAKLRFMPARTRAKRISLGALVALAAAPAASLGDTNGVSSASAETGTPTPTTTKHEILLSRGSEGRQVKLLQKALHVKVDGIFGPETEGAVVMFQKRQGLEADGIVGPRTKAALSRVTAKSGFATTAFAVEATDAVVSGKTKPASDADTVDATISSATTSVASKENPVKVLQETLHVGVDGIFGPETLAAVKRFQAKHHLAVDGIVGPKMWEALGYRGMKEVSEAHGWVVATERKPHPAAAKTTSTVASRRPSSASDAAKVAHPVRLLQSLLHVAVDGEFGPETLAAVETFQREHGLEVDGIVGPQTWAALGYKDVKEIFPLPWAWPKKATASPSASGGAAQASSGGAESGDGASKPASGAAPEGDSATAPTPASTPTGSTFAICVANHEAGDAGSTSAATVNWKIEDAPYEGGFQWLNGTWLAQGGGRYAPRAVEATPAQQIAIFEAAEPSDPGAWPLSVQACGG